MMATAPLRRLGGMTLAALDVAVLCAGWVPPSRLITHLAHPHRWVDAVGTDTAALELARVGLWLAALWLALAVLAVLVSMRPGALARMADGVAGRAVPAVLRRGIAATLGASVVLVPVAAGASTTAAHGGVAGATSAPAAVSSSPSDSAVSAQRPIADTSRSGATHLSGGWLWPTSAPRRVSASSPTSAGPAKPVPWPHTAPASPPAHHPRATPTPTARDVVVGAGDCLWAIAAHRLGPNRSGTQIARETQRWYDANAATVGPDPNLLHPGQHLHAPTEKGR